VTYNRDKDEFTIQFTDGIIRDVISQIEKSSKYVFAYSENVNQKLAAKANISLAGKKLPAVLNHLFAGTGMTYKISGRQVTVSIPPVVNTQEKNRQTGSLKITGNVSDMNGDPLIGLTVTLKDHPQTGVTTDPDGNYSIAVPDANTVLLFSYIGYAKREETVGNRRVINVILQEDVGQLDEVVVVAYGTQKRESVVGAITTVTPAQLKIGTSRSLSNNLAGTVAGIIGVQRSGEPGYDNSDFWIRGISSFQGSGNPLVLVDGIERSLNNIDVEEIESFSVLKDAAASAVYGVRGANGVILINTKRGKIGKPTVTVKSEFAVTQPVKLPEYVGAVKHMQVLDLIRLDNGYAPIYTEQIEKTRTGYDADLYPDVNWIDAVTRDYATNQRVTMEVSGGNERLRYSFVGAFYNEQGIIATDPNKEWDSSIRLQRYNMRSNVDIDLSPTTLMRFNIGGYLQDRTAPAQNTEFIFQKAFVNVPFLFPTQYSSGEIARIGSEYNPWALATQYGFSRSNASQLETLFSIEQDLKIITRGLKLKGTFSFDRYSTGTVQRSRSLDYYNPATGRTEEGDLIIAKVANGTNYLGHSVSGSYGNRSVYIELNLSYNRTFAEKHALEGLLLLNRRNYDTGEKFPFRTQGLAGRTSYTYDGKYIAEFNFGYNGSENFAKGKRYGFFPSGAVGWILSEEAFMKPLYRAVSKLKIRGSYGQVGNASLSGRRFAYISTINKTADDGNIQGYAFGPAGETGIAGLGEGEFGVPDLTWETVNKMDVGLETELFRGAVSVQVDYFDERRSGIFMERESVPSISGFYQTPWSNFGKVHNKGVDLVVRLHRNFSKSTRLGLFGTFTYARNRIVEKDEPGNVIGTSLAKTGNPVNQLFGLEAIGLFTEDDFDEYTGELKQEIPAHTFGVVRPGDIRYRDINNDNRIDGYDEKPIGGTKNPEIVYGFGLNGSIGNVDFGVLFQGNGRTYAILGQGIGSWIPGSGNGATGNIFTNVDDRWTVDDPRQDAFWPRLSMGTSTNNAKASTWWLTDMSLLRVRDIEIGYTFPNAWTRKAQIAGIRLFFRGANLFTFSAFTLWDPELAGRSSDSVNYGNFGAQYPVMKSFSAGLDIRF
jgi:TonB-linked SusC/RagA family outer membrane protein